MRLIRNRLGWLDEEQTLVIIFKTKEAKIVSLYIDNFLRMRVIAGKAKGHRLKVPTGTYVRPATDLVRGAIFSILETAADDWSRVLDLFAGSGALGIEALSRVPIGLILLTTSHDVVI